MDWKQEKESLTTGGAEWWKPTPGQFTVKFLDDGEESTFEWEGKEIKKVNFRIEVEENKLSWGITKGITENSLYGQLVLVGDSKGSLKNTKITLVVKGTGKEVSYTVLEALPLMTPKEEKIKDKQE